MKLLRILPSSHYPHVLASRTLSPLIGSWSLSPHRMVLTLHLHGVRVPISGVFFVYSTKYYKMIVTAEI